jgi:tripartite-type tricarboxylate transporter receptor subunit TctC
MQAFSTFPCLSSFPENVVNVREWIREIAMNLPRRTLLHLAAALVALPALSPLAWSQTYPTRPIRIVVGFGAGSVADILARLVGQWLSEQLGQPLLIDNRPGAGGNLATEAVVRSPPDGYTLLLAGSNDSINATLDEKLKYDFVKHTAPVAGFNRFPLVMVVNPSVPAKTVSEFITYAKANPGKINMASVGNGTVPHVTGELFNIMAGVKMVHVPYRGTSPINDLLNGQVQVSFYPTANSIEHIKAGKLHALAVTSAERMEALPYIPTVGESLPGFEASIWLGVVAPKNTPAVIIDKLNKGINAVLAVSEIKARLAELGGTVLTGTPAEFGKLVADETDKWAKVVRAANMKAE